jgi:hypothetical protein
VDLSKIKNTWDLQKTQKIAAEANKESRDTGIGTEEEPSIEYPVAEVNTSLKSQKRGKQPDSKKDEV